MKETSKISEVVEAFITEEGAELLSEFGKTASKMGYLVTPLLIGDKERQCGFSIVDNREKEWLNKFEVMIRYKG